MYNLLRPLGSTLIVILLCGCGEQGQHASQVIAKVDGTEITASQLNHAFSLRNETKSLSKPEKLKMELVNQLVDQQLLANEALKLHLDRTPEVVQAIEATKLKLYAQAYLDKLAAKVPPISEKELSAFKNQHPEIFLNHQNYVIEKIEITQNIPLLTVEKMLFEGLDFNQLKQSFQEAQMAFMPVLTEIPAEEMPSAFTDKYKQGLKVGDFVIMVAAQQPQIMGIIAIKNTPLEVKQADLLATKLLMAQNKKALETNEINRLKQFANIQTIGRLDD